MVAGALSFRMDLLERHLDDWAAHHDGESMVLLFLSISICTQFLFQCRKDRRMHFMHEVTWTSLPPLPARYKNVNLILQISSKLLHCDGALLQNLAAFAAPATWNQRVCIVFDGGGDFTPPWR